MTAQYRPLILVGAARSGTKLLRDLIANHPDVDKVPYDVNYIWRLGHEYLDHDELSPESLTPEIKERVRRRLDSMHHGAPVLIEKTVSNCLRVPYVLAVFPEASFVHLVRDGVDVVESAYRKWTAGPDWRYIVGKARSFPIAGAFGYGLSYAKGVLRKSVFGRRARDVTWGPRYAGIDEDAAQLGHLEVCAIQWRCSVQKALEGLGAVAKGRRMTIRYESLVRQPQRQLERIAHFAAIDADYFARIDLGMVSTTNVGRGRRNLTDVQLAVVLRHINGLLAELGYACGESDSALSQSRVQG
jgi:hypothetical protein